MENNLLVSNITKYYKNKFKAVDNVSINVNQGEFFTILGPSGSGKTSLLKLIAGFEEISSGSIILDNENIALKKPHERNIGMVFQNYALFPHMTVIENIEYPLRRRKVNKRLIQEKVSNVLKTVDLEEFGDRYPNQLSGGQQQRVALARAIVFSPPLLLLDEPLGALDKNLRQRMQIEVKNIQESLGITTISVTHDQEEALTMSDRICVMNQGRIEQVDTPENLYKFPENKFVAKFIGEINLLRGTIIKNDGEYSKVQLLNGDVTIIKNNKHLSTNIKVLIALRPENIQLIRNNNSFENVIKAKIHSLIYLGESLILNVETRGQQLLKIKIPSLLSNQVLVGQEYNFGWDANESTIIEDESIGIETKQTLSV